MPENMPKFKENNFDNLSNSSNDQELWNAIPAHDSLNFEQVHPVKMYRLDSFTKQ